MKTSENPTEVSCVSPASPGPKVAVLRKLPLTTTVPSESATMPRP